MKSIAKSIPTPISLTEPMMSETVISSLNLDGLRNWFQNAGYRVETVTDPVASIAYLRSATGGVAFDIRPGNRLGERGENFVDVALTAILQVQGEMPLVIVNRWNATRRFARLQLSQPFLVLSQDISMAGGVAPNYFRAQIEIWDHLVQQLIAYLREELPKLAAAKATNPVSAMDSESPLSPAPERAGEPDLANA